MKKISDWLTRLFLVAFGILSLFLLYCLLFNKQIILDILDWIRTSVKSLGYWTYVIISVFAFIESFPVIGVLVPGQTVLVTIAGALGYMYMYYAILAAILGAILGNFLGYFIGLKYGNIFFEKYGFYLGITKVDVKYIREGIEKYGWLLIVFGKFHNALRAFVPFIAGSCNLKTKYFTLFNIIGSVIRAAVMVILGVIFMENAEKILDNIGKILIAIIILKLLYIYFFHKEKFQKYLAEKMKEMEERRKKK